MNRSDIVKIYKSKIINIVVLFIVTALVLYFSLKDNFFEIINQILTMNPLFFILAIVFLFIYYIFNSYIMKLFSLTSPCFSHIGIPMSDISSTDCLSTRCFERACPISLSTLPVGHFLFHLKSHSLEIS